MVVDVTDHATPGRPRPGRPFQVGELIGAVVAAEACCGGGEVDDGRVGVSVDDLDNDEAVRRGHRYRPSPIRASCAHL